jgi:tetratricopeptide (TPR) repeat protein
LGTNLARKHARRELTRQARAQIDSGNFGKAQATLDQIFLISPRYGQARVMERELRLRVSETLDPDTLLDLGRRSVAAGNDEKAADIFRKLLTVHPDHKEGKKELAQVELRLSEKQAARLREEVARLKEKRARTEAMERQQFEKAARSFEQSGEWEQALDVWLKILKTGRNVSGDVDRCRGALYREAEKALKENDNNRAQALFIAAERGGAYRDAGGPCPRTKKNGSPTTCRRSLGKIPSGTSRVYERRPENRGKTV